MRVIVGNVINPLSVLCQCEWRVKRSCYTVVGCHTNCVAGMCTEADKCMQGQCTGVNGFNSNTQTCDGEYTNSVP